MTLGRLARAIGTTALLAAASRHAVAADAPAQAKQILWADGVKNAYPRWSGPFALYSMKPDGSDVRQLTFPEEPFFDARPSVSPDGRRIVFNRQKGETIGIFLADLAPAHP